MEGTLKWRHHENELEICIMTDYNAVNGNIIPGSFVHVTKHEMAQDLISFPVHVTFTHTSKVLHTKMK